MAVLSDRDIKQYLKEGKIVIEGFNEEHLGPSSIDLTLGNKIRVFRYNEFPFIDTKSNIPDSHMELIEVKQGKPIIVHPGELILGATKEYIKMPDDLMARLDGRSSLGRLGIIIHSTASAIDPGFEGNIVLEIVNISKIPVYIWPNQRVCRITFDKLTSPSEVPYSKKKDTKYHQQSSPGVSKISEDL